MELRRKLKKSPMSPPTMPGGVSSKKRTMTRNVINQKSNQANRKVSENLSATSSESDRTSGNL
jgi:hypothetical protein